MYLGVDVGGTKTLVAVLDNHGVVKEISKFPTSKNYDHFLLELRHTIHHLAHQDFQAAGIGIPATNIDRKHGRGLAFSNLPWKNTNIQYDLQHIVHCPVVVENDCKMAVLSEYMLIKDKYETVLYVTISTGIGYGLVHGGQIDTSIGDGGGRTMLIEHKGRLTPWEDFAGGRAIVERYGKRGEDINDAVTWRAICRDLAKGFIELIAIIQPEVIVIGGSVGVHFHKYGKLLEEELKKYKLPLVDMPDLRQAQRPEEAVIYGCYDLAKQIYGHAKTH